MVRETILPGEMPLQAPVARLTRRRSLAGLLGTAGVLLGGCSGTSSFFNSLPTLGSSSPPPQDGGAQLPPPTQQASAGNVIGAGQVKAALILPLSAGGNAGVAGQAMRNAAEMALSEFNGANVQILVFDDAGNPDSARQAAQQALSQGAEIVLGPLFAQSVITVGQVARASNIPVIAFSTDANVASNGIYLLSFLPETDVERIVQYTSSVGRHSYAALIPDNPYGTVVEAAFKQAVARRNGQIVALERYPHDKAGMAGPVRNVAQVATRAEAIFIPDGGDAVPDVVQGLISNGVSTKRVQLLGTGLWDDPRISSSPGLDGARRRRLSRLR
jgi:branched-chain amino acid transport system substrate-binding protein